MKRKINMKKLALYEHALCCSTGVCGHSVDEDLLRSTGVMKQLKEEDDVMMIRYNLAANPNSFVRNQNVIDIMQNEGQDSLPITVLDGEIVKIGAYPTNEEIADWLDVSLQETEDSIV